MKKPNIVLIFSDQQHWHAMGFLDDYFESPNLDEFSKESTVFSQAYCSTPQCSPSRSTLLTGYFPSKTGTIGNIGNAGGNDLQMDTIGKILQEAGYYTGYFGKWHLGKDDNGCDGWDEKLFIRGDWVATFKAKRFLKHLKKNKPENKPFALVFSTINPHDIYRWRENRLWFKDTDEIPLPESWHHPNYAEKPAVQKKFLTEDQGKQLHQKSKKQWKRYRDQYKKCVKKYDKKVGKILDRLKKIGEYDNSVIFITSDHGDMDAHNRQLFKGPFMYDHLMRIPLMVRVPKKFGGVTDQRTENDVMTVNTDIVPTILDFAGVEHPRKENCHGKSLYPHLVEDSEKQAVSELDDGEEFVVCQYYSKQKWVNPIRTIRTREWKYNKYLHGEEELYDMKNDPDEIHNLASDPQYEQEKAHLREKLYAWIEEHEDPFFEQTVTDRKGRVLKS